MAFANPIPEAVAVIPIPDYDSGWFSISKGSTVQKTHNLGGDTDDYIVELEGRGGSWGVNQSSLWRYGEDSYYQGIHWRNLTTTTIKIYRGSRDYYCSEVRIRIWKYA